MPVLVDPLREYPHVPYSLKRWCHMAVDGTFEELHAFAAQLGIPRHRFQGDHYDLPRWARWRSRPASCSSGWPDRAATVRAVGLRPVAELSVCLSFDFDALSVWVAQTDNPATISRGEFGAVAVPRILALLARRGARAT